MDDAYQKECLAIVKSVKDDKYVVLDQTIFYPQGGGQPYDTGSLTTPSGKVYNVVFVGKFDGSISHEVDHAGLKPGDKVTCRLDWPRRYSLMRAHTASHILSALFHENYGALITGNQLSEDRIRIDFSLESFDRALLQAVVDVANSFIERDAAVTVDYLPRDEALADPSLVKLANALPPSIDTLRIVTIGDPKNPIDRQADGGTHVKSIKEIGSLELIKAENKGKANRRVYVRLLGR